MPMRWTASSRRRRTTRAISPASSAGRRRSWPASLLRATGTRWSLTRRCFSARIRTRSGTSSSSASRHAREEPDRLVALLALDGPGDDRPGLATFGAVRALGVLARPARPEGHREDLERRHLGRRLEETAVGLGRHREQGAEPLAVEKHRVAQHVHRARRRLRDDVVFADLVLPSFEHSVSSVAKSDKAMGSAGGCRDPGFESACSRYFALKIKQKGLRERSAGGPPP